MYHDVCGLRVVCSNVMMDDDNYNQILLICYICRWFLYILSDGSQSVDHGCTFTVRRTIGLTDKRIPVTVVVRGQI